MKFRTFLIIIIALPIFHFEAQSSKTIQRLHSLSTIYKIPVTPHIALRVMFTAAKSPTKKVIICYPGRASYFEKNAGLIMALTGHDFSASHGYAIKNQADLWFLDPRGQGGSGGRLVDDSGHQSQRGHIDTFDDYVTDINTVITTTILPHYEGRDIEFYFMGMSMGGHIIMRYLQDYKDQLPRQITGALALVPMIKMNTAPWPEPIAKALVKMLTTLGFGTSYSIGYGNVKLSNPNFEKFKGHHNREAFEETNQIMLADMSLVTGGPTNKWVAAAFNSQEILYTKTFPSDIPVTFFIAGQDSAVISEASLQFAKENGFKTFIYAKSAHNILKETSHYCGSFWHDLDHAITPATTPQNNH